MYSTLKSCACLKMTFKLLGDSSQTSPPHTHIHCFSYLTIECLVHCIRVPHGIPQHASITLSHFTYLFPCDSLLGSSNALLPSMPLQRTCCPAPPGHAYSRRAESLIQVLSCLASVSHHAVCEDSLPRHLCCPILFHIHFI